MNADKSRKIVSKKRNWAFVVYPESAPVDWIEQLQQTGLQCAISPLHDKDINADNSIKKEHWHVIACYSGPTSFNVVKQLTDSFNAPGPQQLEQIRGYYRYLTHKDNPEKAQYEESDIKTLNGFNIGDFMELSRSEVNETKRKLQLFIRENNIYEYSDLMDCLLDTEQFAEHEIASNNTYFFDKYISSRRNKNKTEEIKQVMKTKETIKSKKQEFCGSVTVDVETGEIIKIKEEEK